MPGPVPINDDLKELLELFQSHHVEYLIVGGHALAFYGRPRFTEDLDLFLNRSHENAKRIATALEAFGFPVAPDFANDFAEKPRAMIVLGQKPWQVDLLNFLDGVDFSEAWARRTSGRMASLEVSYISLPDFIASKKATGRSKDLADLQSLEESLNDR